MDENILIEEVIKEIERSCLELNSKDSVSNINRADKFLLGIMHGKQSFCFDISLRILKSDYKDETKEFSARLLYNCLKTAPNFDKYRKIRFQLVNELISLILLSKSGTLTARLNQVLCYIILTEDDLKFENYKQILEILIRMAIDNNFDPDEKCLNFFTAFADEFNAIYLCQVNPKKIDSKINQLTRLVQAHSLKILGGNKADLKIKTLKCLDAWLQSIILPKDLNFSLLIVIIDLMIDRRFSDSACTVIQSILNLPDIIGFSVKALHGALVKNIFYVFPYLTNTTNPLLAEVYIDSNVQHNVFTCFVSFSQLYLSSKFADCLFDEFLGSILNIMCRLTIIGSYYSIPFIQSPDLMVYHLHFWSGFFDSNIVKHETNGKYFQIIFTELFFVLIQKITFYPWITNISSYKEFLGETRNEVSEIFKKMAILLPCLFLDNLYLTYQLFGEQAVKDFSKIYLLEAATFTLGCVANVLPKSNETITVLQEIYGTLPTLCNLNPDFIRPMLTLLSKSSSLITTNFLPVFVVMVDNMCQLFTNIEFLNADKSSDLIVICINFISRVMEKLESNISPQFSDKLIKLFGEMFTFIFLQIKNGQNFDALIAKKNRQSYLSTVKIVMRAMSCKLVDGRPNDSEIYVSQLIREVLELFEALVSKMTSQPSNLIHKDVFLVLQILNEISKGLLSTSSSGKGGLKLIFEKLFSESLLVNAFLILRHSEGSILYLISIIDRCIYPGYCKVLNQPVLNNFVNSLISLIVNNNWQLISIVFKYIKTIQMESSTLIEPIDFMICPLIQEGLKNIQDPLWDQITYFLQFLIGLFKSIPPYILFYNHISFENVHILTLKLLEYSYTEGLPDVSRLSIKCLKKLVQCANSFDDSNPLLLNNVDRNLSITLMDYIFSTSLIRMVTGGQKAVVLCYPLFFELSQHNPNQFVKKLYDYLFSENILPSKLVDSESKRVFYWQYVDNYSDKDQGLELMIKFFTTVSNKCTL